MHLQQRKFFVLEGSKNKFKNLTDTSRFEKPILKKTKNALNGKNFFWQVFLHELRAFWSFIWPCCFTYNQKDMNYWNCIPTKKCLVLIIRCLAGFWQQAPSFSFRVGKSTISKIRRIICRSSPSIFITTVSKVSEFLELWNFLNVIRVIDGKYVAMGCPKNTRSLPLDGTHLVAVRGLIH